MFIVDDGERYNFLPLALIGLALIALAMRPQSRRRLPYALILALMIVIGVTEYLKPLSLFEAGPSWPAEVTAWQRDHHHLLAVWPRPYAADLSDNSRPCSPPSRNLTQSTDPRYCESGWVVGFGLPQTK